MHTLSLQTKATIYSVFSIKVIGLKAIVILRLVLLHPKKLGRPHGYHSLCYSEYENTAFLQFLCGRTLKQIRYSLCHKCYPRMSRTINHTPKPKLGLLHLYCMCDNKKLSIYLSIYHTKNFISLSYVVVDCFTADNQIM